MVCCEPQSHGTAGARIRPIKSQGWRPLIGGFFLIATSALSPTLANATSCVDDIRNGTETDVDCGGGACAPCFSGHDCSSSADCRSLVCIGGTCAQATCTDSVQNGDETDIDCGGPSCPSCNPACTCASDADCAGGPCVNCLCVPAPFDSGVAAPVDAGKDCVGDDCVVEDASGGAADTRSEGEAGSPNGDDTAPSHDATSSDSSFPPVGQILDSGGLTQGTWKPDPPGADDPPRGSDAASRRPGIEEPLATMSTSSSPAPPPRLEPDKTGLTAEGSGCSCRLSTRQPPIWLPVWAMVAALGALRRRRT